MAKIEGDIIDRLCPAVRSCAFDAVASESKGSCLPARCFGCRFLDPLLKKSTVV